MKENEIGPGTIAIDLGLWIAHAKTLVLADLHLGYEEMLNAQGVLLPRINFNEIKERLEKKIFHKLKPETVIINGDLKHEFGRISGQEWSEAIDMLRFLQSKCKKLVLVKGNHDTILGPIAKWEGLKIVGTGYFLKKEKLLICHGHEIPKGKEFKEAKTIVIGHEHPAITIREQHKSEQFKCFLVGKFKGKDLVVLPSMNSIALGTDVKSEQLLSPFLHQDLSNFKVWAVADTIYYFGRIKDL